MPAFTSRALFLAAGLAAAHGHPPKSPSESPPDPKMAEIGRKLVGKEGGFSCVSCHGVGEVKATEVFESEGINFYHSAERLLPEYYRRWMRNPLAIDPQTKMPTYFENGQSPLTEILEGDPVQRLAESSSGLALLVLGSRGYGPVRSVLLGSVSAGVARTAACPVLVVPSGVEPVTQRAVYPSPQEGDP